jgi:general secretion pathway protein A
MYLQYWGMNAHPFGQGHVPSFFVPTEGAGLALTKLRYVLSAEVGVAAIHGMAGAGKTEIARVALAELEKTGWVTASVINPSGASADMLGLTAALLGATAGAGISPLERLVARIVELGDSGKQICLLVDDVHTIGDLGVLEAMRMLLNLERHGRRLLNLVLAGQEGMAGILEKCSAFNSHVALNIRLEPMSQDETKKYILYRLKVAGCRRGIFTRYAAEAIYRFSHGLPRHVNRLCELSLVTGYGLQARKVAPEIVEMAAGDLNLAPQETALPAAPAPTAAAAVETDEADDIMAAV